MAPRSPNPMRSLEATVLLAVAWVSFALSAALLGEAAAESGGVVRHAKIAAVPVARGATSVEEAPAGRASRTAPHSPALDSHVETGVLVAGVAESRRLASTIAIVALDPRLAPYDATAPPTAIAQRPSA